MAPELDDLTDPPDDLAAEIRGMRLDIRSGLATIDRERRGRKGTQRLAVALVAVFLFVGGFFAANWIRSGQISCGTRNNSRADSRAVSVAVADNTVKELDRNGIVDREKLAESNQRVALTKYPPLAC